ncbi:MAG: T9SS type A sorting domain-containing protein [Bacteroidota bacterium]
MTALLSRTLTLALLACLMPLSLSAQYVYTRAYRHNIEPLAMAYDSLSIISVGTVGNQALGFTKMDTSGQILEALTYLPANLPAPFPLSNASLRFVHRHPAGGYVLGGQAVRTPNNIDSMRIILLRVQDDGTPIWTRSYCWASGLGGQLSGLDVSPDGSILIAAHMFQPNLNVAISGLVAKLAADGSIVWFRQQSLGNSTNASFVRYVRNNLSLDQNGQILTGWNVASGGPLNITRGFRLRAFDAATGNTNWESQYEGHKLLSLDYTPNDNGLAAYVEDSTQTKSLVKFDAQGAVIFKVVDAFQSVTDRAVRIRANANRIPYLYANRLTVWEPTSGQNPDILKLPFSTHRVVNDFLLRGNTAFLVGYRQTSTGRIPTLSKAQLVDTVANCFFELLSSNNYAVGSIDTLATPPAPGLNQMFITDSIQVQVVNVNRLSRYDCIGEGLVWPGDANSDGVANVVDILFLGLAWNETGPARANPSVQWQGYPALNWSGTFFNGANKKHADCNGNGHVGIADFGAILLNYGLTHNKGDLNGAPDDPPLRLTILNDTVSAGDTVHAEIHLGSDQYPVDAIHGLAFNIGFNSQLVDTNSFHYQPIDSWLGADGVDMVHLTKEVHNEGVFQVGATRTDLTDVSGYGKIGKLSFVTIDDIAGKTDIVELLHLNLNTLDAFDNQTDPRSLFACSDSVVIVQQDAATAVEPEALLQGVQVFPNPAQEVLSIASQNVFTEKIELLDLQGRIVLQQSIKAQNAQISVAQLPRGVYLLRGDSPNGVWMEKLIIQ